MTHVQQRLLKLTYRSSYERVHARKHAHASSACIHCCMEFTCTGSGRAAFKLARSHEFVKTCAARTLSTYSATDPPPTLPAPSARPWPLSSDPNVHLSSRTMPRGKRCVAVCCDFADPCICFRSSSAEPT